MGFEIFFMPTNGHTASCPVSAKTQVQSGFLKREKYLIHLQGDRALSSFPQDHVTTPTSRQTIQQLFCALHALLVFR